VLKQTRFKESATSVKPAHCPTVRLSVQTISTAIALNEVEVTQRLQRVEKLMFSLMYVLITAAIARFLCSSSK